MMRVVEEEEVSGGGQGSLLVSSSPSFVPMRYQLLDSQKYLLTDRKQMLLLFHSVLVDTGFLLR